MSMYVWKTVVEDVEMIFCGRQHFSDCLLVFFSSSSSVTPAVLGCLADDLITGVFLQEKVIRRHRFIYFLCGSETSHMSCQTLLSVEQGFFFFFLKD